MDFHATFSSYDPSTLKIILKGIPIFQRSVTVTCKVLAHQKIDCMGDRDVVLMKSHGIAVIGPKVEEAIYQCWPVCKITWNLSLSGKPTAVIPGQDLEHFTRLLQPGGEATISWQLKIKNLFFIR